ncbi:MAG: ABC transporter permease [Clostridiales Family XIII bacterium]|nr:ABC transporter permease [Clostridiales Family XIII bacterium]
MWFVLKRIGAFAVSLAVLAGVVFSLLFVAPGDPARSLVGTKKATPELLAQIRANYHLDEPFFAQFGRWLDGVAHLDFGVSIRSGTPVVEAVAPHAAVTIRLILLALILSVLFGVLGGIVSAKGRGKLRDGAIGVVALVGTSAPSFAVGLLFLYVFALRLGAFPVYGIGDGSFADTMRHLALPAITLAFGLGAMILKITRSAMLAEIASDYTVFLRARSIPPLRVTFAQVRNAAAPILTSTGLVLASLFGSTVLIESVFAIPGLGNLLASSVTFHDVPVVQFIALMLAFFICAASMVVDILVYFIDPRTRQRGRAPGSAGTGRGAGQGQGAEPGSAPMGTAPGDPAPMGTAPMGSARGGTAQESTAPGHPADGGAL